MAYTNEEKPLRLQSPKLVLEELQDELMIYDPARKKAFCLNQSAAFVWKHSDGKRTISEITGLLGHRLGRPISEKTVRLALDALSKDGLLAEPAIPSDISRTSERAPSSKLDLRPSAALPALTKAQDHDLAGNLRGAPRRSF